MSENILAKAPFEIRLDEGLVVRGIVKTLEDGLAKPILILNHGFRGSKDWSFWPQISNWFAEEGFYTVIYDFSRISAKNDGLGEETIAEAHTLSQEISDLDAVVKQVAAGLLPFSEQANRDRIALIGHSRAGGTSIIYANEHPANIGAVVVWNGGGAPNRPNGKEIELTLQQKAVSNDLDQHKERFNVIDHFKKLERPVLVVQGDKDNERHLTAFGKLQETNPGQSFASISGADHTFGAAHPYEGSTPQLEEAFAVTLSFLKKSY